MATTQEIFKEAEGRMQGAIDVLAREFAGVRTGRASAGLLEGIRVEYYNALTPLNQVATVSVPDPKTILIQPWEPVMLSKIEKMIQKSDLGLTPVNDGRVIRLNVPPLTEDRRKQLAKVVGKLAEDERVAIRNVRRESNEKLRSLERAKKASEDEVRRGQDQIQKLTDRFIQKVDELLKKKEAEILEF